MSVEQLENGGENKENQISILNVADHISVFNSGFSEGDGNLKTISDMGYTMDVNLIKKASSEAEIEEITPRPRPTDEKDAILYESGETIREVDADQLQQHITYLLDSNCLDYTNVYGYMNSVGWETKVSQYHIYTDRLETLLEIAQSRRITIKLDHDRLAEKIRQDYFDMTGLPGEVSDKLRNRIVNFAAQQNIELPYGPNDIESEMLYVIHSPFAGHVDRSKYMDKIPNFREAYNTAVHTEFRDVLNIPKQKWMDKSTTTELIEGGRPLAVEMHGYERNIEGVVEGKFILGKTSSGELAFVFDGSMGEHQDIKAKYSLTGVFGGGWLIIDSKYKRIILEGISTQYDQEPRIISATVLKQQFPEYEVCAGRASL